MMYFIIGIILVLFITVHFQDERITELENIIHLIQKQNNDAYDEFIERNKDELY